MINKYDTERDTHNYRTPGVNNNNSRRIIQSSYAESVSLTL